MGNMKTIRTRVLGLIFGALLLILALSKSAAPLHPRKPEPNKQKPSDGVILLLMWIVLFGLGVFYCLWPRYGANPAADPLPAEWDARAQLAILGAVASLISALWFSFSFLRSRRLNELGIPDAMGLVGTTIGCAAAAEIILTSWGVLS